MAKKPSRKVVGQRVQSLAYRLSDDLLALEEETKAAIERKFVAAIPRARRVLDEAYSFGLVRNLHRVDEIGEIMAGVLARAETPLRKLLREAGQMTLESMTAELRLCERSLNRSGVAVMARESVEGLLDRRVRVGLGKFRHGLTSVVTAFVTETEADWYAAVRFEEELEDVDRRLFSVVPVRLEDHRGRGAWWKPFQHTFATSRSQEFNLVNDVRAQMMWEFNREVSRD